jgi:glycosyltransferase involved in cell wall biosynthesis
MDVSERLRIAVVSTPWYPLPPGGYGGIELMAYLLSRELRRLSHDVIVIGPEGSAREVEPLAPAAWSADLDNPLAYSYRLFAYLARVARRLAADRFDVLHDNCGYPGVLAWALTGCADRMVHTIHEPIDEPLGTFLAELRDQVRFVAISHAQTAHRGALPIAAVVHNAVDLDNLSVGKRGSGYLVELGRIVPEKGQHLAIEVARRTGKRLVLAGKVPPLPHAERYFCESVEPHLGDLVEYRGSVAGREKAELLAGADAGVFPLQWEEPFGLAMAECMASGTPVIALRRGSAGELVDEGVTGFLADDVDGLVDAAGRLPDIDRERCAEAGRARFSPRRMALEYIDVYTSG